MHNFIAFDLGASSGRAILGALSDKKLKIKEIHRFPNSMLQIHGHYYWNIFSLFEELKTGLKKCTSDLNVIPEALGIDTWGVDFALLDKTGKIIGIPFAYRDPRNSTAMEEVFKRIPKEDIYGSTGIAFWPFNSLYQLFAWKRDLPEMLGIADNLLFMPDIFNYLFTEMKSTEYTFASTSQLLNANTRNWEMSLFEKLDLPSNIMNNIVEPGTVLGKLDDQLVEETGASDTSVVAVGSHDTASAIVAIPGEGDNWSYISSGTWSLMGIESNKPVISDKTREYNLTNEGGVGNRIRLLKNIMGLWLLQECKRIWALSGEDHGFPELVDMAEKSEPFMSVIDPDWMQFYNPPDMTDAIREFCRMTDQPQPETKGQFVRIILEGLALKYRQINDQLKEVSGKSLDHLHIIGGGSQNELLCQFAANATGAKVITGPAEATAAGNLMVQAMAMGYVKDLDEIRQVIRNSFDLKTFLPENTMVWDDAYSKYLEILKKVRN